MTTTRPAQGWLGPLLLRLHFYAAILVGPFLLVSAASGALYALRPQLEKVIYAHELNASRRLPRRCRWPPRWRRPRPTSDRMRSSPPCGRRRSPATPRA
uniref:PepSY-associated TM helix domain-containing protein n=1 Tax=Brachybacterium paraconglomeratum TaxID=173362 RepID=UPI00358DA1BD